jgi:hypothetical protein
MGGSITAIGRRHGRCRALVTCGRLQPDPGGFAGAGVLAAHAAFLRSVVLVSGAHPEVARRGRCYAEELPEAFVAVVLSLGPGVPPVDRKTAVRASFPTVFSPPARTGWPGPPDRRRPGRSRSPAARVVRCRQGSAGRRGRRRQRSSRSGGAQLIRRHADPAQAPAGRHHQVTCRRWRSSGGWCWPACDGSPRACGQQRGSHHVTPCCARDASISRRCTPSNGGRPDHGISRALKHAHRMSS